MPKLNIADPEFSYDDSDPEGYRCGMARVGPGLGAEQTGEEEWVLVLARRCEGLAYYDGEN